MASLIIGCGLGGYEEADAACMGSSPTWNATADEPSIQTCMTNATAGDTINVAAGSFTVTTGMTTSGKGLTITGAGAGSTNITDNGSAGYAFNFSKLSAANFTTISGFTFIRGATHAGGMIQLSGGNNEQVSFRFHHNTVSQSVGGRGIFVYGTYGLIDHNTFTVTDCSSMQSISIQGTSANNDGGHTAWSRALSLGTDKAVYVEDNVINRGACLINTEDFLDMYSGARLVFRYNIGTNYHIGFHGTDSGGMRSAVSHEVYHNTFTNTSTTSNQRAATVRGGTGVWFSNTWNGTPANPWGAITLMNYRACNGGVYGWGVCNGAQLKLTAAGLSSNGSRTCSTSGTIGFDSTALDAVPICKNGSGNCTAFFDGSGTGGYPCRDQVGRAPGQALEPLYIWSNTGLASPAIGPYDGGDASHCNGFGIANYILAGRDYVDNGTTPKPGYTAYTYPHPLSNPVTANLPDPGFLPREGIPVHAARQQYGARQ